MKKTIRYLLSGLALLSLGACTSSDNEDGSGGNDGGLTFVTVVSPPTETTPGTTANRHPPP